MMILAIVAVVGTFFAYSLTQKEAKISRRYL